MEEVELKEKEKVNTENNEEGKIHWFLISFSLN